MKNSFSRYNLLNKDYLSPFQKRFRQLLRIDLEVIKLTIPYYDFLRGQVFIDDIKSVFEECPDHFDLAALFSLLHDDFLHHMKKGSRSNQQTAEYLLHGEKQYLSYRNVKKREKAKLKQITAYTFVFDYEDEEDVSEEEKVDNVEITLTIKESKLQRTEILLYDLSEYMSDKIITVEDMLSIVYLDFIEKVKKEGNNDKVMKAILKGLEFYNRKV